MSLPHKLRLLAVIPVVLIAILFMFVLDHVFTTYQTYEKDEAVLSLRGSLASLVTSLQVERGLSSISDSNASKLFKHAKKRVDKSLQRCTQEADAYKARYDDVVMLTQQYRQSLEAIRQERTLENPLIRFEHYSTLIESLLTTMHALIPASLKRDDGALLSQLANLQEYYAKERGLSALYEAEHLLHGYILQRISVLIAHEKVARHALSTRVDQTLSDALDTLFNPSSTRFITTMHQRYELRDQALMIIAQLEHHKMLKTSMQTPSKEFVQAITLRSHFFSTIKTLIALLKTNVHASQSEVELLHLLQHMATYEHRTTFDVKGFRHDLAHLNNAIAEYIVSPIVPMSRVEQFGRYSRFVNQIDALHSDKLNAMLQAMNQKKIAVKQELFLLLFLILFLFIIAIIAAMKVYQSLMQSIELVATSLHHFFMYLKDERKEIEPIAIHSDDQLGVMAKQINLGIDAVKQQLLSDKQTIVTMLQILSLMKEGDFSQRLVTQDSDAVLPNHSSLEQLKVVFNEFLDVANEKIDDQTASLQRLNTSLEQKVSAATEVLEEKLQQLQTFEAAINASAIVIYLDEIGRITYVNKEFEQLLGFSAQQSRQMAFDDIIKPSHLHFEGLQQQLHQALWRGTIACEHADGSHRYMETTITPHFYDNAQQSAVSYIVLAQDVSEIITARDEAIALQQLKEQFFSNMSHEIRTPLNAVIGFADIVAKSLQDQKLQRYMQIINASSKTLLHIINDILDFSKIEAGQLTLHIEEADVADELGTHLYLLSAPAYDKALNLLSFIDPNLPKNLRCDIHRLKQIVANLYANAIKFTEANGTIYVKIYYENGALHIIVRDTGIGIEEQALARIFNPYEQADGSTMRRFGGTGLGLAITKALLTQMGGMIDVTSKPDVGSHFHVQIPMQTSTHSGGMFNEAVVHEKLHRLKVATIQRDSPLIALFIRYLDSLEVQNRLVQSAQEIEDSDIVVMTYDSALLTEVLALTKQVVLLLPSERSDMNITENCSTLMAPFDSVRVLEALEVVSHETLRHRSEQDSLQSELHFDANVLVVEDNKTNQLVISLKLQEYGLHVDVANDGAQGLQMAKAKRYNLILMDENMPVMSGIESLQAIRAHEQRLQLQAQPIVALTANVMVGDRERFISAGMDDYLAKPIDDVELERVLLQYLSDA